MQADAKFIARGDVSRCADDGAGFGLHDGVAALEDSERAELDESGMQSIEGAAGCFQALADQIGQGRIGAIGKRARRSKLQAGLAALETRLQFLPGPARTIEAPPRPVV
jgi:hypothetical protein